MSWRCPDDVDAYLTWRPGEGYEATALNKETMEQAQEVWPTLREALTALRYLSKEVTAGE